MAELKILGKTIMGGKKKPVADTRGGYEYTDEDKGIMKEPGGYQLSNKEWDEKRDLSSSIKPTTLKNEKYNPVKITKKEVSVEGNRGSVDKTSDVIGPDMGKVVKEAVAEKEMDLQDKARRSMGFKKGGKAKSKCMASGGKVSQLAKANGIAVRGKSRGRIV
jgi:hypothetical protein